MIKKILGVTALLGMVCTSSGASALTFFIQPASGRPWNIVNQPQSIFANVYNTTDVTLFDAQVCSAGTGLSPVWITDVQIDLTNTTYSGVQDRSRSGLSLGTSTFVKSRLVSFTAGGAVHQSTAFTDAASLGSLTVPTNGTLFVQSQLQFLDIDPDVTGEHACLRSVRVTR